MSGKMGKKPQFFTHKQQGEEKPPEDKIPGSSMPESGEHPYSKNIEKPAGFANPVSTHGNIYIIPKPGSQGNVPSAPKFCNTGRNIRIIKIFCKMKTENFPKANSHITVTGKVKINMQTKGYGIHPVKENRFFCGNQKGVAQFPKLIGNKNFFSKPKEKTPDTKGSQIHRVSAPLKLRGNLGITYNRPCN